MKRKLKLTAAILAIAMLCSCGSEAPAETKKSQSVNEQKQSSDDELIQIVGELFEDDNDDNTNSVDNDVIAADTSADSGSAADEPPLIAEKPDIPDSPVEDFNYWETDDGGIQIEKYTGSDTVIGIPNTIDGKPVTVIKEKAFERLGKIESVRLPETIKEIDNNAFFECVKLKNINLPSGISRIGVAAFYHCIGIETLEIPAAVTEIEEYSFAFCKGLKSVHLPDGVTVIGKDAFDGCKNLKTINFPGTLKEIRFEAFYECGLESVTIPDNVTEIGERAFLANDELISVVIGDGVEVINGSAFDWCNKLTDVTLGNNVKIIHGSAFAKCPNLTDINIPDSVEKIDDSRYSAFYNSEKVKPVYKGKTYNYQHLDELYSAING